MNNNDFTTTLFVDNSPEETFNKINNVRNWWTENVEGSSEKLDDEFTVRFSDVHVSTQKLVEVIKNKKVVWLVTNSKLNFIKKKDEWTNTTISFEIAAKEGKTQIIFKHIGLVPQIECYNDCTKGWEQYINGSLLKLLTEGKGVPDLTVG